MPERSGRILVVDDDPDFAEGLDVILALEGFDVVVAGDPASAIRVLDEFPADIALIDVRLRDGSGIDLIGKLRERRRTISCVMMTAFASADSAIEALHEGAVEYLRKPIHSSDLLATLDRRFEYLRLEEEKHKAEESLREIQARFRSLVDNSPSAHDLKDLDGRLRVVNPRFMEWFVDGTEDVVGKTAHDLFPADIAQGLAQQDRLVTGRKTALERERDIRFADGQVHRVVVTKYPIIGPDGTVTGIGTIFTDVTDRKEAEEQLIQAQKMEAVGKLTGGVAHDFNNLLAVIVGYAEIMSKRVQDDAELSEYVNAVSRAASRGAKLTRRLLTFSRKQPLRPKIVDLSAMLADMSEILDRTLGAAIELEASAASDLTPVLVDTGQLEAAVLNLVLNARDAMPTGGRLVIRASNAGSETLTTWIDPSAASQDFVVMTVSDTGTGMSREILDRAVEPFFTTKAVGEGTGLGLSMVHGFASQSGGHLSIDSSEGSGTTVSLFLPRSDAVDVPVESEPAGAEPSGLGETVLVVEDNADVRSLAVSALEGLGYDVHSAQDANDALERIAGLPGIDLILSDVMLPGGVSGPELADQITRTSPGTAVLFMSALPAATVFDGIGAPEGTEFLDKPFKRRDLAEKVRAALDR